MQHHLASSKRAGLTQEDWQALKDFDRSTRFSPEEQAALRFAEKITLTPTSNAGAEADQLQSLFSDQQRVDIVATVALANLTNRITDGLGIDLEFAPEKI